MNTRLLYIILAVQFFFAVCLIFVGGRARDARRVDYLERTHRVTAGKAGVEDFTLLNNSLPPKADKESVRILFGPPVVTARAIKVEVNGKQAAINGDLWLYYPLQPGGKTINDSNDSAKLSNSVQAFVIQFDETGQIISSGRGEFFNVLHPIGH